MPQQTYTCAELVCISTDRKELHAACLAAGRGNHLQRKYSFLGLAITYFQGTQKLVGRCSHPGCYQSRAEMHVDPNLDALHNPHLSSQHYSQDHPICKEAAKLLRVLAGEASLRMMLARPCSPGPDSAELVVQLEQLPNRKLKMAVRHGCSFKDWAMIVQHVPSTAWFCTACPQIHACAHLATAKRPAIASGKRFF